MRNLASVQQIRDVLPIEGADSIVLVKINDWQCVALKDEFKVGDLCIFFEIDSYIPLIPQVEHIKARAYKRMGEKEGVRIRTIKLRKQLSQGLALPVHKFFDMFHNSKEDEGQELGEYFFVGNDVSDLIGVEKYEPMLSPQLVGQVRGTFPSFIQKTDQTRCQNIRGQIFEDNKDAHYEVSLKLDGTSMTSYLFNDRSGVCSRNLDLKTDDSNATNSLVRMYADSGMMDVLVKLGKNIAVQGELMGPGIQKNRESFLENKLFVFDMYDIDNRKYFGATERNQILNSLYDLGLDRNMVQHVPVYYEDITLQELNVVDVDGLLSMAEGRSINHLVREGLVFKRVDGEFSFKSISNQYLLKEED